MSLILHTLTLYQIARDYILTVDDITTLSYVGLKRMSISTAKDYTDLFARIFNFYESKFIEGGFKKYLTFSGVEKEFNVANFFPDILSIPNIDHGMNSNDFFNYLTNN